MATKGSPLKRQYERIKADFPDGILLFRLGDFYETFGKDAEIVSRDLGITLTSKELGRGHRVPLAGVPTHSLDASLARLLEKGHRVAICEQLGDPRSAKGIMEREIIRVVTPGTILQHDLLPENANNFLAAVLVRGSNAGLAYADISTSEFIALELPLNDLHTELATLSPAELLVPGDMDASSVMERYPLVSVDASTFDERDARQRLLTHFSVRTLDAYGCENLPLAISAAGAVLAYLQETQRGDLTQIQTLATRQSAENMVLDPQTVRTLELFEGTTSATREGSLFGLLDTTQTPMGRRLLRQWLGRPLLRRDAITERHDNVEALVSNAMLRSRLRTAMHGIPDLERLINFIRAGSAAPRDIVAVRRGLDAVAAIVIIVKESSLSSGDGDEDFLSPLAWVLASIDTHDEILNLLHEAISEEPGATVSAGSVVRKGFSPELEELRAISSDARVAVAALETEERAATGIPTLKVGYTRVFGYYIEVTRSYLPRVPEHYIRKQTIAGGERFFTGGLKELEIKISEAQQRAEELESALFHGVCNQILDHGESILSTARAVASLDVLAAFAENAVRLRLTRPEIDNSRVLEATAARHPVVEALLDEPFVPNEINLSEERPIAIITGPNMAGKSTYLRQIALVVLMAQIGSFVPASQARIGIVDRIFTRAGLQDDISTGRSTFMVEMTETAAILHQATDRSLIILDETGRGTSTYDGLSIAWAVVEHIHNHPRLNARTAFATHYHELVELGETLPRAFNLHVLVSEEAGKVVFLRQVVAGGAARSYGVHVAQLAGLPRDVIVRAQEVLSQLEMRTQFQPNTASADQPALFTIQHAQTQDAGAAEIQQEIRRLSLDQMTPLEALAALYKLQRMTRDDQSHVNSD